MNIDELMALADTYANGVHMLGYFGAHREKLRTAIERLTTERDALRTFAQGCLDDWPEVGMDGFDLQELGVKTGMLEGREVFKPCHDEGCQCAEYYGSSEMIDGVICYRMTPLLTGKT